MTRRLQSNFSDHVEYAFRQALCAIAATSVGEIGVIRSNLTAPFLIGVLAFLVSKPHVGETLADVRSLLMSIYGLLLAWPIAYGIGPGVQWAYGIAIFVCLFLADLLDESTLRSKIAQLFMLIVFALFATASDSATRDSLWLIPPRLAGTCALGAVFPVVAAFVWPRYASEQISLRLRAAARVALAAFALTSCAFSDCETSPTAAADGLRARGLRRLSQDLCVAAGALLTPARTEQWLRLGTAHANEHAQLLRMHSNLLALERALAMAFHVRSHALSRHIAPALSHVLVSLKRVMNGGRDDDAAPSLTDEKAIAEEPTPASRYHVFGPEAAPLSFEEERVLLLRALFNFRRELYGPSAHGASSHFDARGVPVVGFWIFHAISFLHHTELMHAGSPGTIGMTLVDVTDGEGVEFHSADSESADDARGVLTDSFVAQIDAPPEAPVVAPSTFKDRIRRRLPFALRNAVAIVIASLMFLIPAVNAVWEGFGLWCAVSTLLVLESDSGKSVMKSVNRLTGTALGAAFGAVLLQISTGNVYGNMVGLFFWLLLSGYIRATLPPGRSYSAYVMGFTPILVVATAESGSQDADVVASLRIQLTFLGCFVGIVSIMLPRPEWLGGDLLRKMSESLALSGTVAREILRSVMQHSAPSQHIDDVRLRIGALAPLHTTVQGEPVLWHTELPTVLTASVIKRLVCVQRRLVWCHSAAMRLHSHSANVTRRLFVDPLHVALSDAADACVAYADTMSDMLRFRKATFDERRELDERLARNLLALKKAQRKFDERYNDVSHSIVQGRNRMQTRDVIAFVAFVFAFTDLLGELEALYQDVSQMTAAVQLTKEGSDLRISPASAWIQTATRRHRKAQAEQKPLLAVSGSSASAAAVDTQRARSESDDAVVRISKWKRRRSRRSTRTTGTHDDDDTAS